MFQKIVNKYKAWRLRNHIESCRYVAFRIIPKANLKDKEQYLGLDIAEESLMHRLRDFNPQSGKYNKKLESFICFSGRIVPYDEFYPIKVKRYWPERSEEVYPEVLTYNPKDINALDLEEIKNIIYNVGDSTTIESDDVWERLVDYFEKRNLNH